MSTPHSIYSEAVSIYSEAVTTLAVVMENFRVAAGTIGLSKQAFQGVGVARFAEVEEGLRYLLRIADHIKLKNPDVAKSLSQSEPVTLAGITATSMHAAVHQLAKHIVQKLRWASTLAPADQSLALYYLAHQVRAINRAEVLEHLHLEFLDVETDSTEPRAQPKTVRRRSRNREVNRLTDKQKQALEAYANCGGNTTKAAESMGIDRKTYRQHLEAAKSKIGGEFAAKLSRPKTKYLPVDKRGQTTVQARPESDPIADGGGGMFGGI